MRRKDQIERKNRRLLELWQCPPDAGEPIGVLCTTFTFDAAFFEEECLARFAGVQSDAKRDGSLYRIEREERLAQLRCAAVVVDQHHASGSRSLRWDLIAARPRRGIMHAKIALLAWERKIRVIVGSANLTPDAYRRNHECLGVVDFTATSADRSLLVPLVEFLHQVLETTAGAARDRARDLLAWVSDRPWQTPVSPRGIQRKWIFTSPDQPTSALDQLAQTLPGRSDEVHVVSPFFDREPRRAGPERVIWERLIRLRGDAALHFHVSGTERGDGNGWRLAIPKHVAESRPSGHRPGTVVELHAIPEASDEGGSAAERRPLHAKTLALSAADWSAQMIGSSNFTCAGLGVEPEGVTNYEANLLYWIKAPDTDLLRRDLESRSLKGQKVADATPRDYVPAFDVDEAMESDAPVLPHFFGEAVIDSIDQEHIQLSLKFTQTPPPLAWSVADRDHQWLTSEQWHTAGSPNTWVAKANRPTPTPSSLRVQWSRESDSDTVLSAQWPLNVRSPEVLPTPDELQSMSLQQLLDLMSSARPLHETLRDWLRRQPDDDDADPDEALEVIDPHAKVDTSGYLIQRVRRACWAMRHLRTRLEQPVSSLAAWTWRIQGPVGAQALMNAMLREADADSPDEAAFLLMELGREMDLVEINVANDASLRALLQQQLDAFRTDLRRRLVELLPNCSDALRQFADAKMEEHEAAA